MTIHQERLKLKQSLIPNEAKTVLNEWQAAIEQAHFLDHPKANIRRQT